ncbi:MAG: PHP domain-containing protein [Steroidobacteraceae bacterium]|nr:PHP domain-containing protein [Steroidobacteraceae bacterium]
MNHRSAVDLHLHSTASDGMLSPAELVAHVAACGVRLMALTDHDTVAGVAEAAAAAQVHGIGFVAGVEISVSWRGRSLHLLGLAIDPAAPALTSGLAGQVSLRLQRAARIAERLDARGAPGREALEALQSRGVIPTRMHFARELVALGIAPDPGAAFERWLGRGRPGHVRADWPELAEATRWIRAAGGKAAIAHPMRYPLSAGARRELCAEFAAAGGHGIEVVTGGGSPNHREQALSLAVRSGLEGSVGSDFHDPAIPWNPPGRLAKLPGSVRPVWRGAPFPGLAADPETA